jgi:glutamine synthetase
MPQAADNVQMFKDVVRNVAKRHDKVATFMPKPFFDENNSSKKKEEADNGSGMHMNISIWQADGKRNLFFDPDDKYVELSQFGRYFVGGILDHASSLSAIVAPTINSYKRLIPGFEAPVYMAWARGNRSAVVRVPAVERNSAKSKRVEFRAPDPSANPYLALSAIVAAGMDGIAKKREPADPVNGKISTSCVRIKKKSPWHKTSSFKPRRGSLGAEERLCVSSSILFCQRAFAVLPWTERAGNQGGKGREGQILAYQKVL